MSRSKKEWNDTESMLTQLTNLLVEHAAPENKIVGPRADAESLRRISMTLHRWHELECNGEVERDENTSEPRRVHWHDSRDPRRQRTSPIADKETGACKRLAAIMARYPALTSYIQTDPRGCALYILKPGDVPEGGDVSAYYSRGLAVYK